MKTLDAIMIECQSDKASQFTRTWAKPHNYCVHYDKLFEPIRFEHFKLLEVGVGGGESVQAWLEYFNNACVMGVDLVKNTNPWNDTLCAAYPNPRYAFSQGDQSSEAFWNEFIDERGKDWQIIIDDGSHVLSDIMTTFNALWPHVVSGGLYCIEDLTEEHAGWLSDRMRVLNMADSGCDSIHLSRQLAIFKKR